MFSKRIRDNFRSYYEQVRKALKGEQKDKDPKQDKDLKKTILINERI